SERPRQESHAEGRQRGQQARARRVRRKEGSPDLRGEERVSHEVVELQAIAQCYGQNLAQRQTVASMLGIHWTSVSAGGEPLASKIARTWARKQYNRAP